MEGDIYNASEIIDKLRRDVEKLESDCEFGRTITTPQVIYRKVFISDGYTREENERLLEEISSLKKEIKEREEDSSFESNLYFFVCLILISVIIYLL